MLLTVGTPPPPRGPRENNTEVPKRDGNDTERCCDKGKGGGGRKGQNRTSSQKTRKQHLLF